MSNENGSFENSLPPSEELGGQFEQPMPPPEEMLQYVAKLGRDLAKRAETVQAMLAKAHEEGIVVDLSSNEVLQKFNQGDYEIALYRMMTDLTDINSEMLRKGVRMGHEELAERLSRI